MFIVQETLQVEAQPYFLESLQSLSGIHNTDHSSCDKYCTCEQSASCVSACVSFRVHAPVCLCMQYVHMLQGVYWCFPHVLFFRTGRVH